MVYKSGRCRDFGGSGDDPTEEWNATSFSGKSTRSQQKDIRSEPWWSRRTAEDGSPAPEDFERGAKRATKKRKRRGKLRKRRQVQAPIHLTRTALLRSMYIRRWIEEETAQDWYEKRRAHLQRNIRRMRSFAGHLQQHQQDVRSASDDEDSTPGFVIKLPVGSEDNLSEIKDKVFPLIMAKLKENNYPEKEKSKIALEVLRRLQFPIVAPKVAPVAPAAPVVEAPAPVQPEDVGSSKEQEEELPKYGIRRSLQNLKKKTDVDLPKRATSTSRAATSTSTKLRKNKSLEVAGEISSKPPRRGQTSGRKSVGCQTLITSTQIDSMLRRR